MQWSADQDRALVAINNWLKNKDAPRFSLGGYAGTGKTTLAKHIASMVDGEVKFAAFTGKAASVLRKKGCPGATTIHKLCYQPKGTANDDVIQELQGLIQVEAAKSNPDEMSLFNWRQDLKKAEEDSSAIFQRKQETEIQEADLVIIDESSMVDRPMGRDVESYGVPVLYLGDPGQLEPVKGKAHLGVNDYDFVLEEIHRQAADSPIIWLANEIRNDRGFKYGTYGDNGEVLIARKSDWDMDRVINADQVLTGMNASRWRITRSMRKYIGFEQLYPLAGDKLICKQNDHEAGFLNGVTCKALAEGRKRGQIIYLDVNYEDRERHNLICDPGLFQKNYGDPTDFPRGDGVQKFDYGYCTTGHSSQGSQWPHVVIADDKMQAQNRTSRRKWLYTVFTRAEERLTYYA